MKRTDSVWHQQGQPTGRFVGEGPTERRFLTTQEAAEYLRESPRTLEGRRVSGDGPVFYKAGKGKAARVLYRREDLDAWVEARMFKSTSEYGVKA